MSLNLRLKLTIRTISVRPPAGMDNSNALIFQALLQLEERLVSTSQEISLP